MASLGTTEQPAPASPAYSLDGEKAGASSGAGSDAEDTRTFRQPNGETLTYTAAEERALLRKVDWLLLPILTALYLLSFLDRSNIGNAKVEGIERDIRITNYPLVVTMFFIGYVIFEIPANLVLKVVSARSPAWWLAFLTIAWGAISIAMGFSQNQPQILAIRFLLGMFESGLFPGCVYIFSRWYTRQERVARVSFFFSAAAAAGSLGGILAYAITRMDGIGGQEGWRWLFQLEGALTVVFGVIAIWAIPAWPAYTRGLTEREKSIVFARLSIDSDATEDQKFEWSAVTDALKDVHVWLYAFLFHGAAFSLYTLSIFLPAIIQGLGYRSYQVQLLTIPPYFFAFLCTMACTWASRRVGLRAPFIIGALSLTILGYIVLITSPTVGGKYTAVFLAAAGIYAANALLLAWPSENIMGQTKRAVGLAAMITIGNIGSIIGTNLYRVPLGTIPNHAYRYSQVFTIGWLLFAIGCASTLWVLLSRANRRLDREEAARRESGEADKAGAEAWRLGWRYQC